MNIERLQMLQDLITRVSDGKWYGGEPVHHYNFLGFKWPKKNNIKYNLAYWYCKSRSGNEACAIGHAMLDKQFNELGFNYSRSGMMPSFEGKVGFTAIEKFFDINIDTALMLFHASSYSTDCQRDPLWFLMRLDWLLNNAHCNEDTFKLHYKAYGKAI